MENGACRVVIKWGSRCQPRTNPTADNLRKGLKQSFGMDKTGPNPPTRRDHLIPPVPRAKRLPSAGTNTNQKGCQFNKQKKPSRSAAQRKAGKQTSSRQHQASKASKRAEAKQSAHHRTNNRPTTKGRAYRREAQPALFQERGEQRRRRLPMTLWRCGSPW